MGLRKINAVPCLPFRRETFGIDLVREVKGVASVAKLYSYRYGV
jgi:hypothetical protein